MGKMSKGQLVEFGNMENRGQFGDDSGLDFDWLSVNGGENWKRIVTGLRTGALVAIPNDVAAKAPSSNFYTLLSDKKAVNWLMKRAGKSREEAQKIVRIFRFLARQDDVPDSANIHADVLPGCLFKRDIPKMGPCYGDLNYLQDWKFSDLPTERCLVSWIPAPIGSSVNKTYAEQMEFLAARRAVSGLPEGYELTPGSVGHIGGMALAHLKATGKDPFNGLVVRTSTCSADGYRLYLHWLGGGLDCAYWYWDGDRVSDIAAFGLGVVKALGR